MPGKPETPEEFDWFGAVFKASKRVPAMSDEEVQALRDDWERFLAAIDDNINDKAT
jgi:hypothetical protein